MNIFKIQKREIKLEMHLNQNAYENARNKKPKKQINERRNGLNKRDNNNF